MANKNGYVVTRSNYSIRSRHQKTRNGEIYVRDYMTTSQPGSWDGEVFPYGESNFKMVKRISPTTVRKHSFGSWYKDETCPNGVWTGDKLDGDYKESLKNIKLKPNFSTLLNFAYYGSCLEYLNVSVNNIVNNYPAELYVTNNDRIEYYTPDSESANILGNDFANDVNKVWKFVTNEYPDIEKPKDLSTTELVLIDNPFEINLSDRFISDDVLESNNLNKLRYFCRSANSYIIMRPDEMGMRCACKWNVIYRARKFKRLTDLNSLALDFCKLHHITNINSSNIEALKEYIVDTRGVTRYSNDTIEQYFFNKEYGFCSGNLVSIIQLTDDLDYPTDTTEKRFFIYEYFANGRSYFLCDKKYAGVRVRPTDKIINDFFNNLSDLESLLLNKNSLPIYTCDIDYPHENKDGFVVQYKKKFTWPTNFNWNLDVSSDTFRKYIKDLSEIATFYDNGYSDNMWNRMTHDSIKNMDLTFKKVSNDEDSEDYELGTSRVESIVRIIGKQFDEIKAFIDGIKTVNNITYSQDSNIPDFILSDSLELAGWEVYDPINGLFTNNNNVSVYTMVDKDGNKSAKVTAEDAAVEFLRNLRINSREILSRKGTKAAIEMVMSLFGYASKDFVRAYFNSLNEVERSKYVHSKLPSGTIAVFSNIIKDFDANPYKNRLFNYDINEYVYSAEPLGDPIDFDKEHPVEKFNRMRENYIYDDYYGDTCQGLPCKMVYIGENGPKYIIPWFDSLEEYDGDIYFQMFGGWGNIPEKTVTGNDGSEITIMHSTERTEKRVVNHTYGFSEETTISGAYDTSNLSGKDYQYDLEEVKGDGRNTYDTRHMYLYDIVSGDTLTFYDFYNDNVVADFITIENGEIPEECNFTVTKSVSAVTCPYSSATVICQSNSMYSNVTVVKHNTHKDVHYDKFNIYDEDVKYIKIVRNIEDLVTMDYIDLKDGEIIYVYDISDYNAKFNIVTPDEGTVISDDVPTHYFMLNKVDAHTELGGDGWENISSKHTSQDTIDHLGYRVLYLENLIDNERGNAPHVGYGKYDDGEEYLKYFRQLFYNSLKYESFTEDAFDCETGLLNPDISQIGFNMSAYTDNIKCWYFDDIKNSAETSGDAIYWFDENDNVGDPAGENVIGTENNGLRTSKVIPHAFEPEDSEHGASAANSLINVKKLTIDFYLSSANEDGAVEKKFILNSVLPYIEQVIPSTAILGINFFGYTDDTINRGISEEVAENKELLEHRY